MRALQRTIARMLAALAVMGAMCSAAASSAGTGRPVAIVQDVSEEVAGVTRLDLLEVSRTIELSHGRIVLGYLQSCWEETVTGGRIVIGTWSSEVIGGQVQRRRVECGTKDATAQTPAAASLVNAEPEIVLFGRSPVVLLPSASLTLTIERLDQASSPLQILIARDHVDLAEQNITLEPAAHYRARAGGHEVVFHVDVLAEPGPSPAIGRVLILRTNGVTPAAIMPIATPATMAAATPVARRQARVQSPAPARGKRVKKPVSATRSSDWVQGTGLQ